MRYFFITILVLIFWFIFRFEASHYLPESTFVKAYTMQVVTLMFGVLSGSAIAKVEPYKINVRTAQYNKFINISIIFLVPAGFYVFGLIGKLNTIDYAIVYFYIIVFSFIENKRNGYNYGKEFRSYVLIEIIFFINLVSAFIIFCSYDWIF